MFCMSLHIIFKKERKTREILQDGSETWLYFKSVGYLTHDHRHFQRKSRNFLRISFCVYVIVYLECSNLQKSYCISANVVAGKFPTRLVNLRGWKHIYCHRRTVFCCITILQCGLPREMLQAGIKTRLCVRVRVCVH